MVFLDTATTTTSEGVAPPSAPAPYPIDVAGVNTLAGLDDLLVGSGWLSGPNVTVSDASGLVKAVNESSVGRIVCEDGHYLLNGTLSIARDLYIGAAATGTVVLDAQNRNYRVLSITAGSVQLVGLDMTGGHVDKDDVSASLPVRDMASSLPFTPRPSRPSPILCEAAPAICFREFVPVDSSPHSLWRCLQDS